MGINGATTKAIKNRCSAGGWNDGWERAKGKIEGKGQRGGEKKEGTKMSRNGHRGQKNRKKRQKGKLLEKNEKRAFDGI